MAGDKKGGIRVSIGVGIVVVTCKLKKGLKTNFPVYNISKDFECEL